MTFSLKDSTRTRLSIVLLLALLASLAAMTINFSTARADHVTWALAGHRGHGWYVGDFNGDRKDDIFRQVNQWGGAEVLLSNGNDEFDWDGEWLGNGARGYGWYVGDFNGDGKDDIFRQVNEWGGAEVFLSDGSRFVCSGCGEDGSRWAGNGHRGYGWYVGDFDGDGDDDIFRQANQWGRAEMFLSNGVDRFVCTGCGEDGYRWLDNGARGYGWYVGDFNGDGKDDIFRQVNQWGGAEVFLSNGSRFVCSGCGEDGSHWNGYGHSGYGWNVGDFDGDGDDDIFRQVNQWGGAEVFLSNGVNQFVCSGCGEDGSRWSGHGHRGHGWYIGDFNGDGIGYDSGGQPIKKVDIFRQVNEWGGAEMFLSNGVNQFVCSGCGENLFNGTFTGTISGDNSSSSPATIIMSQTGNQVNLAITVTGPTLQINGGICGTQTLPRGSAFGPLTATLNSPRQATGTFQQQVAGQTVTGNFTFTLDASGHNLQGTLDLNLPFPCSDSTLTGSFTTP